MKPDTTNLTALEPASSTSVASGHPAAHPCRRSAVDTRTGFQSSPSQFLTKPVLTKPSAANAVPESVRVALGILNRRADQQCLVDGIAQLNGGGGGATQMGHRDGNDIGARSPGRHDDAGGQHDVDQTVVVSVRRAEFEENNGSGG